MLQGAAAILLVIVAITPLAMPSGRVPPQLPGDDNVFVPVLPPDAIPAILEPRFEDPSWLRATDGVLGVEIKGEAHAYPLRILVWHEVVNDVVGGIPIAATHCPLCGTGMVFGRTVAGGLLTFHVSGRLFMNNLVMFDAETRSLWPQVLGKAAAGPLAGEELNLLPSSIVDVGTWLARHPGSPVLARPRCGEGIDTRCETWPGYRGVPYQRDYNRTPYGGYDRVPYTLLPRPYGDDGSLGPKEAVLGVIVGGTPKAYPYKFLVRTPVVNDVVTNIPIVVTFAEGSAQAFEAGGRRFRYDQGDSMRDQDGGAWDMLTGAGPGGRLPPLRAIPSFWFAWYDFYPDTQGYGFEVRRPGNASGTPGPLAYAVEVAAGAGATLTITFVALRRRRARRRGRGNG